MGRNEIKLREELMTGQIHRHRNYDVLLKQHRRSRLFKQTVRFFIYSLIVTFIVLILITLSYYVIQLQKKHRQDRSKDRVSMTAIHNNIKSR